MFSLSINPVVTRDKLIPDFIKAAQNRQDRQSMMFLRKIRTGESGILTYGITPPKSGTTDEKISGFAARMVSTIQPLNIDALVVYDVEDESARTPVERPFPFVNALDPFQFASAHLRELAIPKIIYRPAGKFTHTELSCWLSGLNDHAFYPVFVGVPMPDYPVKTSLPEAYSLWRTYGNNSVIGAVTIPERHQVLKDEHKRIMDKASHGVSFFISQCVFNVEYAKAMIDDLVAYVEPGKEKLPTIIFTLAACGSPKTIEFMEWLGIHLPEDLKHSFLQSQNMLEKSVGACIENAKAIAHFCIERSIPFGFNVESVATRKEEVVASLNMTREISSMLCALGVRDYATHPETRHS